MAEMKQQLADLYELQQADTGIAARKKALRALDDGSKSERALAAAVDKLNALRDRQQSLEGDMVDRELQLKGAEEERTARSKQAYGGTISDPKQLSALEKKIAELGRTKDRLEEEILGLMEELEKAQAQVAAQQTAVDELERKTTAIKQRYESETKRLRGELKELEATRNDLAARLDPALLKQYDALREKAGGLAVAAVRRGSCEGCRVSLPSTYAPRLQAHSEAIRCENCRRILYLPPGESPFVPQEDR